MNKNKKKVLLIVVDALATRVVQPGLVQGLLPNFARLIDAGGMRADCTSIFPSITPAATASIATGCYPREHGIAGAFWYEADEDRVAYYGDDVWVMLTEGVAEYFQDFLVRLNFERLRTKTVFERVEHAGLNAACLTYLWFKGDVEHEVDAPFVMKLVPGMPFSATVKGPTILCMGDFITTRIEQTGKKLKAAGGMSLRYGFHDDATSDYLMELARHDALPDFTLAYFPNNDFESHERGPHEAVTALHRLDQTLGELISVCGGLEQFLDEFAVLITGDHSQCDMLERTEERDIDLSEVLNEYKLVNAGDTWQGDDDVMVCPNMRAAQIYMRRNSLLMRDNLIQELLEELRIDQVIWMDEFAGDAPDEDSWFHIATADRGHIRFRAGDDDAAEFHGSDVFDNRWSWTGDLSTVDGRLNDDGLITFGEYPNAFERVAGSFIDVVGELWVTARPGCEFLVPGTSTHAGGSHGSLHRLDSESPLIFAGVPESVRVPEHVRTIDAAAIALAILGVDDGGDGQGNRTMNRCRRSVT